MEKKERQKFIASFVANTKKDILNDIEYGKILPQDFVNKKVLWKKITESMFYDRPLDYKSDILARARNFSENNDIDCAKIFYSIYIEHTLNKIIHLVTSRRKITSNSLKSILRYSNINDKLTWLLELLSLPSLDNKYKATFLKLFDDRNSFIHYKWNTSSRSKFTSIKLWEVERKNIEKAIVYLKKYESKVAFLKKKNKFAKIMREIRFKIRVADNKKGISISGLK